MSGERYSLGTCRYCVLEFEVGTRGERIRESFQLIEGEIAE